MKTVKVVAAIIRDGDKVFATQRGYGDYKDVDMAIIRTAGNSPAERSNRAKDRSRP